jgi:hypothetical protein
MDTKGGEDVKKIFSKVCDTCRKFRRKHGKPKCAVLTENIGLNGDCWAWTDDKGWAAKAQKATEAYIQAKGGESE